MHECDRLRPFASGIAAIAVSALVALGGATTSAAAQTLGSPTPIGGSEDPAIDGIAAFLAANPGAGVMLHDERISRVFGKAFAHGATPAESAEAFRLAHAAMFGVEADDLVPGSTMPDGRTSTPILFDPATGSYRFTGLFYIQSRGGVPVYEGQLRLIVRNEPGFPLVLASSSVRDIGAWTPAPSAATALGARTLDAMAAAAVGGGSIHSSRTVIFAGAGEMTVAPRLAHEAHVINGHEEWRSIVDAQTGELLHSEFLICFQAIAGSVDGQVTTGLGSEQCEPEEALPLPYIKVTANGQTVYTDESGNFAIPSGPSDATVSSSLDGLWFDVFNIAGANHVVSAQAVDGAVGLLFNPVNDDPLVRAQVNAYREANLVRDYVLQFNPAYPTLQNADFTVNVNRTDGFCPGNAWYSSSGPSINFCQAGPNNPNTAFASVVYHEYGHHLINAAGSGQGAYGEGMSDCISVVILDSPLVGLGFFNSCNQPLRNAENDCQFQETGCSSCGSGSHACGRLLSGCVWDLRKHLFASHPEEYLDILSSLTINSILLHTGTSINSAITVDFLTLDDDNGDILDGTPHYEQINSAFGAHGMPGPALASFKFVVVGGAPSTLPPTGASLQVLAEPVVDAFNPATGKLVYRIGNGPWSSVDLESLGGDLYAANFGDLPCGAVVHYYFLGIAQNGQVVVEPAGASANTLTAFAGYGTITEFEDDFETNQGWGVVNSQTLADGGWERAVPVTDCFRGNPLADADGSGACYLTDNGTPGNCNSDVDDGATTLISPVMDASDPSTVIEYWRWFSNDFGASPFTDSFKVDISGNGGASWVNLETVGPTGPEVSGGWFFKRFRVADFLVPTSQFRIRFVADDFAPGSVVEAAVDGVRLLTIDCVAPPPTGDLDGNGVIDGADLGLLLGAWGSNGGPADLNGDGTVDGTDLGILLANWG